MKIKTLIFIAALMLFMVPMNAKPCLAGNNETEEDVFDADATTQSIETVAEPSGNGEQNTEGEKSASGNQTGEANINDTEDDVFDEGTDATASGSGQGGGTGGNGTPSTDGATQKSENSTNGLATGKGTESSSTTTSTKTTEKSTTDKSDKFEKSKDAQSEDNSQSAEPLTAMPIGAVALIIVMLVGIIVIFRKRIKSI